MAPPFVVKPAIADNSQGVALVSKPGEAQAAIAAAFALCDRVLLERFVPLGREVRCGVVEDGDRLVALPLEEYRVDPVERPIRRARDKLSANEGGDLGLMAKTQTEAWIMPLDDPIVPAVNRAALACHRALGCRDHSLFDFRIDPAGEVWFLEAGPYCSFAPESVVVSMMDAAGTGLSDFFAQALDRAVARNTRTKG
jgi:D-alanine-D-alanine ligase